MTGKEKAELNRIKDPAELILARRIGDILVKDQNVYRDTIAGHIDSVRLICSGGPDCGGEEKGESPLDILKSIYFDQVTDDVSEYFEKLDVRTYNRFRNALTNPAVCGIDGGPWGVHVYGGRSFRCLLLDCNGQTLQEGSSPDHDGEAEPDHG